MFRGASTLNLDDKGRFAIPTKYRNELLGDHDGQIVCTIDTSAKCLLLYPLSEWLVIEQRLAGLANTHPKVKRLQRLLVGNAMDYQLDKNGRVLLAPNLRNHAELGKKIVLQGQMKKFEIWSESNWHEQQKRDLEVEFAEATDVECAIEGLSF